MEQGKDRLMSTAEAADRLGVSPRTIARWIKSGELRGVRLGKRIFRVPLGEVLRIIAETYERETPPEPMEKPSSLGEAPPDPEPAPEPPEEEPSFFGELMKESPNGTPRRALTAAIKHMDEEKPKKPKEAKE